MNPTEHQIKEIAGDLDIGFTSYFHPKTGELLTLPSEEMLAYGDAEPWEEAIEKIEEHGDEYIQVTPMSSREGYSIMEDFANSLNDAAFQQRLRDALNGAKPFANFKYRVEDSVYRQDWFAFRNEANLAYVRSILTDQD